MSIRKRTLPSGSVVWLAGYRDSEGKRRFKQFPKKSAADAYLIEKKGEVRSGRHVAESASPTFGSAADDWLTKIEKDGLERSTIERYRATYTSHVKPELGSKKLSTITPGQLQIFIDTLAGTMSASSLKKVRDCIRQVFSHSVKRGRASHNPATDIDLPVRKRGKGAAIEMPAKAELRKIVEAAPERWTPYIRTAILTGMRASELRGLTWDDVDLDRGVISVTHRMDRYGADGPPKSNAGRRDIPLSAGTVDMLKAWQEACPKSSAKLVFPAPEGGAMSHQNFLRRVYWPTQVKAGVAIETGEVDKKGAPVMEAKYTFHALRHAAAALFIEQGLQPKKVQTLMGHASIQITMDVYGYLWPKEEEDRAAMGAIDANLFA